MLETGNDSFRFRNSSSRPEKHEGGKLDQEVMVYAGSSDIDFAVMDMNLAGILSFPVADVLRQRGIPFVFATGYGGAGVADAIRSFQNAAASAVSPSQSRDDPTLSSITATLRPPRARYSSARAFDAFSISYLPGFLRGVNISRALVVPSRARSKAVLRPTSKRPWARVCIFQ
jgi:CheY-like chemotaxis protein